MDVVERYLLAVQTWLPAELRVDVVKELRGDLEAELAERAAAAARPLGSEEIEAVLRRRGHPLEVAGAYLPHRHLVGPALYPAYRLAVGGLVLGVLVPLWLLVMGPLAVLSGAGVGDALLDGFWGLVRAAVFAVGLVTLLFAAVERGYVRLGFFERWRPGSFAALSSVAPEPASRAHALVGLVITLVLTATFLDLLWSGTLVFDAFRVELAPGWILVRWLVLSVALGGVAGPALEVAFPGARRLHHAVELLSLLATAALAGALARAAATTRLATVHGSALPAEELAWLQAAADRWARHGLLAVVLVCAALAAWEGWRLWRLGRAGGSPALSTRTRSPR
ncbi:MAG: hypothetical protein U0229_23410 [Anaeromyxobacter sp.]